MVNVGTQTQLIRPATVVGVEEDILIGVRVRKSFGSRSFWGSVVGCYWVSGGLFYKVSFDDGDVDIFTADEVLQDAEAAKTHAKEDPRTKESNTTSKSSAVADEYIDLMRQCTLKRKRDEHASVSLPNICRVSLWGQRLYASIFTNEKNETFIRELLKTDNGKMGEMEATGLVEVGDLLLAVNEIRVLGMSNKQLAELIRKPTRPVVLTLYRPQRFQRPQEPLKMQQPNYVLSTVTSIPTTREVTADVVVSQPLSTQAPFVLLPSPSTALHGHLKPANQFAQQFSHALQRIADKELIRQRNHKNLVAHQSTCMPTTLNHMEGTPQPTQTHSTDAVRALPVVQAVQSTHQRPNSTATIRHDVPGNLPQVSTGFVQQLPIHYHSVAGAVTGPLFQSTQALHTSTIDSTTKQTQSQGVGVQGTIVGGPPEEMYRKGLQETWSSSGPTFTASMQGTETLPKHSNEELKVAPFLRTSSSSLTTTTSLLVNEMPQGSDVDNPLHALSFLAPNAVGAFENSFMSPIDSHAELARPRNVDDNTADNVVVTRSRDSLVAINVYRDRLYLTLGLQGSFIAVTSFVVDEFGHRGEVELSGKVFLGDVLVRINNTTIHPGMTPSNVAYYVNSCARPITLWFERASWDVLNGKA
ncbi:hypothetical protein CCR75_007789 [Bremia lactucae]|uniref:PDZ domain-containing protein n=1 Tax=Bremia lactucae TaxID=4779 RepID=A0A976FN73_BRELC|nr:hypothetical protein CCR75_007789 [Bremia lactucae]